MERMVFMEKELLKKLNIIRKDLEIPMDDFIKIIALAKMHCKQSKLHISDEMLYEIVLDSLSSYDYKFENKVASYSPIEAIKLLIESERKERHISDDMLFDYIDDYLSMISSEKNSIKSNEENVVRSIRKLDY